MTLSVSETLELLRRKAEASREIYEGALKELAWLREVAPTIDSEEDRGQVAAIAYWSSETRATWIAEVLGYPSVGRMLHVLPPYPSGVACGTCSKEIYLRSRRDVGEICDECRRNDTAKRGQQLDEAREKQDQRIADLRRMPYAQFLKSPEWQQTRQAKLRSAAYRCQLCNGKGVLNVHHRTYVRRGNEWMSDLIVLCSGCHEHFHAGRELAGDRG